MALLTERDVAGALRFLETIETADNVDDFYDALLRGLRSLIACSYANSTEVNSAKAPAVVHTDPTGVLSPQLNELFSQFLGQHPFVVHAEEMADGRARTISEFASQSQLHRLDLYQHVYKHVGCEYLLGSFLSEPDELLIGIGLIRDRRDFSARDRELLSRVRPHIARARRNAALRASVTGIHRALETAGEAVLVVRPDHQLDELNAYGASLLGKFFDRPQHGSDLPEAVRTWIVCEEARLQNGEWLASGSTPLEIVKNGSRLTIRYPVARLLDGRACLLLREHPKELSLVALSPLGLSHREAEVLLCATNGSSNDDIAQQLFISARTVAKHLEHVYAKLGVSGRREARKLLGPTPVY